jgi:hypothetical protein
VAIFHHSLPFLQSESFQTHVGTIHRRAIGPLAHHNGTSAYSPSLICHLPAPTIECLHRPPYKLMCSSHNFPKGVRSQIHVCTRVNSNTHWSTNQSDPEDNEPRNHRNACLIVASITMLLITLLDDNEA